MYFSYEFEFTAVRYVISHVLLSDAIETVHFCHPCWKLENYISISLLYV